MTELWRTVKCCPVYQVSNLGRVRRLPDPDHPEVGGILQSSKRGGNNERRRYESVTLTCAASGFRRDIYVHQLVARAFLGRCPRNHEVNHRDFNRSNNRASNLEYKTHIENIRWSQEAGRYAKKAA